MERLISVFGLFAMIAVAWLLSAHKRSFPWRVVLGGLLLQFAFGYALIRDGETTALPDAPAGEKADESDGQAPLRAVGDFFTNLLDYVDAGAETVFGEQFEHHFIAFKILPTIIFFSSLMSIMYYLGIVQVIVACVAWLMQKTLGTSGAESLSAAANIFVGQTEAPLVVRPYVNLMTQSELMAVMVGGFATIAGGVLAAYAGMGIDAGHLVTASIVSAPAALLIAKVMQPEVETPKTLGRVQIQVERNACNVIEAAANGASEGLKLALNVGAMLIAFVALVAMVDSLIGWIGSFFVPFGGGAWSLQNIFGFVFYPFAWLMSIPQDECFRAGQILGTKMVLNEFVAYTDLAKAASSDKSVFSTRTVTILTYALCGFANFSSIGIQLGGIGGIAPERKSDLAKLGLRAMFGGTLAAFMTACVAATLLSSGD